MRVRELLGRGRSPVITIDSDARVDAAVRLMIEHRIGALPVMSGGMVVGIVSERDIVELLGREYGNVRSVPLSRIMRRAPTCNIDDDVRDLMVRMTGERLRHFVVMENGRLSGIVSVGDIVKRRLDELELETGVLRDYVAGRRAS
ncbi:MAG: CBS domain-containing protein [Candidatus Cloacimonetes bacterium]|nr:CBS domain-containing protein [Candidatus Cloacimonadota bacterium]